ncbi:MAG TPA: ferritin-like domain-containing protein [Blastocatellia bacterium]|jgi:ferritin-like protein|nr:ferritin-like domain-containing protein [Blastocatellia bacterium]
MPIAWHAPYELMKPETQDLARAIQSLMEELEAIDWYGQRIDVSHDAELRDILAHNRDEEKEHAAMILEWIRRRDPKFDEVLKTYLFTTGDITHHEEAATAGPRSDEAVPVTIQRSEPVGEVGENDSKPALTVGSLRQRRK